MTKTMIMELHVEMPDGATPGKFKDLKDVDGFVNGALQKLIIDGISYRTDDLKLTLEQI